MSQVTFKVPGIKGKTFVAGLTWLMIPGIDKKAISAQVQKTGKNINAEFVCQLTDNLVGYGLVNDTNPVAEGFVSIAAIVSNFAKSNDWGSTFCSVFELAEVGENNWLCITQIDGVIAPDGDVVGNEDFIRTKLLQFCAEQQNCKIICPDSWSQIGSEHVLLIETFLRKGKKYLFTNNVLLSYVHKSFYRVIRPYLPYASILVVMLGCFIGWQKYKSNILHAKMIALEQARISALRNKKPEFGKPWEDQELAKDIAIDCESIINKTDIWPSNWEFVNAKCDSGKVQFNWKRNEGSIYSPLITEYPNIQFDGDAKTASLQVIRNVSHKKNVEVLPTFNRIEMDFRVLAQEYGITFNLNNGGIPNIQPDVQAQTPDMAPPWKVINFTVGPTTIDPQEIVKILGRPGFRIDAIVFAQNTGVFYWTISGKQYVNI